MSVTSTEIPLIGSFTFFHYPNDPRVTVIFTDRSRLEFVLLPNLAIDRNSTFRFLTSAGTCHDLSWSSTSVHDVLGITCYLNHARQYVASISREKNPETAAVHAMVEAELARIRAVRAVHLGNL